MTFSNMVLRGVLTLTCGLAVANLIRPNSTSADGESISLPIETVGDYAHALIEADWDVYTRHVVERLQSKRVVVASENWEQKNTLTAAGSISDGVRTGHGQKGNWHTVSIDQPLAN